MRLKRFSGVMGLIRAAAVVSVALFAVGAADAAKPGSTLATFSTPGTFTWTVPNGVKRVTFDLFGAAGGRGVVIGDAPNPGGLGGEATATFDVQSGQVFEIVDGGKGGESPSFGAGGFNGGGAATTLTASGGGGGGTDVRTGACAASMSCDLNGRLLVAGGGGGGGSSCASQNGGGGGGYVGGSGSGGCGVGGGGGTQTSGGAGGAGSGDGSFGSGGSSTNGGGGGGGGWYGGGGGGDAGGGGGSGFIAPWAVFGTMQAGVQSGDGRVVISKG
jgi:hypothetical protein